MVGQEDPVKAVSVDEPHKLGQAHIWAARHKSPSTASSSLPCLLLSRKLLANTTEREREEN